MIYTVADALDRIADFVGGAGVSLCDDESREAALRVYNRVISRLFSEGAHNAGIVRDVCLPICDCCLVLDSSILNIRAIREHNGPGFTPDIQSQGFKYLESGPGQLDECCGKCLSIAQDLGDGFVLHQELPFPMHILAFSDRPEDSGALLTVQGKSPHGRDMEQQMPIKMNAPSFTAGDGFETGLYSDVTLLRKPVTAGFVSVFGWLPDLESMVWLTTLRPDELSPSHRKYMLDGVPESGVVKASVTLRFIPATHESQIALIQNMDALEAMAIALGHHDTKTADGFQLYQAYRNSAVSQLSKGRRESGGVHRRGLNIKVAGSIGRAISNGSSRRAGYGRRRFRF